VIARTAMTPAAAMQRKAIGLAAAVVVAVLDLRLRCSAGDERRQTGVVACFRLRHARLIEALLRLRVARLIGTVIAWHEGLRIRRDVRLWLARAECLVAPEWLRVLVAVLEVVVAARLELLIVAAAPFRPRLEVRILLTELLVGDRDQPKIMFGMLKIIFRRDRIAGRLGIAGKLEILFRHVIGRAANLHIRAVGLIDPRQRVVIAAVIVLLIVAPAHTLVVMVMLLTVSHGLLFNNS